MKIKIPFVYEFSSGIHEGVEVQHVVRDGCFERKLKKKKKGRRGSEKEREMVKGRRS